MIKVGILGASGYTGAELVRLLTGHPAARITAVTSETYAGKRLREVYPGLGLAGDLTLTPLAATDLSPAAVDAVFLALPHGESQRLAPKLVEAGLKVIDLSGDFRFPDTAVYEKWYQQEHVAKGWAEQVVYGFPELFRKRILGAQFVANPGCFVTAAVLALYPLVREGLVDARTLVVDAKTGLTGSGRKTKFESMYMQVAENVVPYKVAGVHQHTPEMELALSQATGQEVVITFTPQLVPVRRGILAMTYGRLLKPATTAQLVELYRGLYQDEPFVTVWGAENGWPDLTAAAGSNQCLVRPAVDERTGLAVVAGVIDNLVKGASGQAIQNFNLMFGLDETAGLPRMGFTL
jgi:N-acetyl-gamma-glutamyl-phosphate reductase